MFKLPVLSANDVIKVLRKFGFNVGNLLPYHGRFWSVAELGAPLHHKSVQLSLR